MSIFDRKPVRVFVNDRDVTPEPPVEQVRVETVEPVPVKVLPPFSESTRCPKCAYDAVSTEYRVGAHEGCMGYWWHPMYYIDPSPARLARDRAYRDSFPEHLDRKCARCSHQWAEATVPA